MIIYRMDKVAFLLSEALLLFSNYEDPLTSSTWGDVMKAYARQIDWISLPKEWTLYTT